MSTSKRDFPGLDTAPRVDEGDTAVGRAHGQQVALRSKGHRRQAAPAHGESRADGCGRGRVEQDERAVAHPHGQPAIVGTERHRSRRTAPSLQQDRWSGRVVA